MARPRLFDDFSTKTVNIDEWAQWVGFGADLDISLGLLECTVARLRAAGMEKGGRRGITR